MKLYKNYCTLFFVISCSANIFCAQNSPQKDLSSLAKSTSGNTLYDISDVLVSSSASNKSDQSFHSYTSFEQSRPFWVRCCSCWNRNKTAQHQAEPSYHPFDNSHQ